MGLAMVLTVICEWLFAVAMLWKSCVKTGIVLRYWFELVDKRNTGQTYKVQLPLACFSEFYVCENTVVLPFVIFTDRHDIAPNRLGVISTVSE